jgi:hypothetical protein
MGPEQLDGSKAEAMGAFGVKREHERTDEGIKRHTTRLSGFESRGKQGVKLNHIGASRFVQPVSKRE